MEVIKRNGSRQKVIFDKVTHRISSLCYQLDGVDPTLIAKDVIAGICDGVHTTELDELAAQTAVAMTSTHPNYGELGARITISNLHKNTMKNFADVSQALFTYINPETDESAPLLSASVYEFIQQHKDELNGAIIHNRDFVYDYFGFKTLCYGYLFKLRGEIAERPQHMLMRVACGLHTGDINAVLETYDFMSQGYFTHASPTLFNAGTPLPQLSSCFLLTMRDDSIEGIYETLKQCALISKGAGGVGLAVHNIRAKGSYIRGSNGISNGLVPMLRVFNNTALYVDQGGGKRKGAFCIYLAVWHADIFDWLELKKNTGVEENRARNLFYALWICDEFMRRVENDQDWSLFCPKQAPGLDDCWGVEFETLYSKYEQQQTPRVVRKQVKARKLWHAILESQMETGGPFMLFADACNAKSNQQHLGTLRSSNLCTEILLHTSLKEIAVCNLSSIAVPMFVDAKMHIFDFGKLQMITKIVTRNLNKIIDINYYPCPEAEYSNKRHRPIGIGIQGEADAFVLMRYPYESEEAAQLNRDMFEAMCFAAYEASCELAEKEGPYPSFAGSPMSKGKFPFDLWNVTPSGKFGDWDILRTRIMKNGIRNSTLLALMPTASTSQILGNNECFEPYTSNLYVRRTLSGEHTIINKHLVKDLCELKLWCPALKNKLVEQEGSVQNIAEIPDDLKELYKTVWEIKGKRIVDMAADRGCYICQSQSLNVHMKDISFSKLASYHFYAWKRGLKTGMYYLRSQASAAPIKFTVDQEMLNNTNTNNVVVAQQQETEEQTADNNNNNNNNNKRSSHHTTNGSATPSKRQKRQKTIEEEEEALQCSLKNRENCVSCGS